MQGTFSSCDHGGDVSFHFIHGWEKLFFENQTVEALLITKRKGTNNDSHSGTQLAFKTQKTQNCTKLWIDVCRWFNTHTLTHLGTLISSIINRSASGRPDWSPLNPTSCFTCTHAIGNNLRKTLTVRVVTWEHTVITVSQAKYDQFTVVVSINNGGKLAANLSSHNGGRTGVCPMQNTGAKATAAWSMLVYWERLCEVLYLFFLWQKLTQLLQFTCPKFQSVSWTDVLDHVPYWPGERHRHWSVTVLKPTWLWKLHRLIHSIFFQSPRGLVKENSCDSFISNYTMWLFSWITHVLGLGL